MINMTHYKAILFGLIFLSILSAVVMSPIENQGNLIKSATIFIDTNKRLHKSNPLLIGSNIQWVDEGDGLLSRTSKKVMKFNSGILAQLKKLKPTSLRYPGGSHSDLFHWRHGAGSYQQRKTSEHYFTRKEHRIYFGTREFLTLCGILGAQPIITANLITGTAKEAADWLDYTNQLNNNHPAIYPKVNYWELGNEPYLKEKEQQKIQISPREFIVRVNRFITELRKRDPTIKIGIPLRNAKLGGIASTPYPDFNKIVLAGLTQKIDFISLHNAYLPIIYRKRKYTLSEIYLATVNAAKVVRQDLDITRSLLKKHFPSQDIKIAITEYSALFTLNRGHTDSYIQSLASAIYLADLLRMLSLRDDVLMANYWSLSENGHFGLYGSKGQVRSVQPVLSLYKKLLVGYLVDVKVTSPLFSNPQVGFVPSQHNMPQITAVASLHNNIVRVVVINKSLDKKIKTTLHLNSDKSITRAQGTLITGQSLFAKKIDISSYPINVTKVNSSNLVNISIPKHSIIYMEFRT